MIGWFVSVATSALLIVAFGGWITQGTTVAFALSLAGVPGCF